MEDQPTILLQDAPDVEDEQALSVGEDEEESENSESEFDRLSAKVNNMSTMMEQYFPLLQT
jgi:hypothetical protein